MQYGTPACLVFRCSFRHEANSSREHCAKNPVYSFYLTLFSSLTVSLRFWELWSGPSLSAILACKFSEVPGTPASINPECEWYLRSDYRNRSLSRGETVLHSPDSKCNTVKTETRVSRSTAKAFSTSQMQELCSGKFLGIHPHIFRGQFVCVT